ncbi:MAG: adenine deaminase C-terminal domain-containing protein [Pseudomonadota bacterium]
MGRRVSETDLSDRALRDRAVAAARGAAPFDLLIRGARLADMLTGQLRPADIGLTGALIASVHPAGSRSDAARTLAADGLIAAPGLIDTHMHIESSMVTPATYANAVLPRGVTTVVWDPHEFANVAGAAGMAYALAEAAASPLRILPLAPSCVPSAPGYETAGADFDADAVAGLLAQPGIHGLAEVMDMAGVIGRSPRMTGIVQAGLLASKPVFGHARGLSGSALQAYATAGVSSDHELTSAEDLLEKIAAGLVIELRGSHPYLLPEFAAALQALPQMPPTVTLCSDDVFPDELEAQGTVDQTLRSLVRHGLDPLRALQAATLNAALRLGRPDLGLIAPGRRADIVLLEDLAGFQARYVLCDGVPPATAQPAADLPGGRMLAPVDADAFALRATGETAQVAVIDRPRFTQWDSRVLPVIDGRVAPPPDVTRIAVLHRHGRAGAQPRLGFLTGWGAWRGAFATTVSHDSHNLTVFGHTPRDMAAAANALIAAGDAAGVGGTAGVGAGGGMAVAQDGEVTALLPLPLAGLVSDAPLSEIAEQLRAIRAALEPVIAWNPPYLTFKALVGATLACNAGPHQTDLGIADPLEGRLMSSPLL